MDKSKIPTVPSAYKIGDPCVINFGKCGMITSGFISASKFTDNGKVFYDVKIYPFRDEPDNKELFCLLQDVDSYFVESPEDYLLGNSNMISK